MIALHLKGLLGAGPLAEIAAALEGGLREGGASAGALARDIKRNTEQFAVQDPALIAAGRSVQSALLAHVVFQSWALPRRLTTVLFNRYDVDQFYGDHVDNALVRSGDGGYLRGDLAFTVFLTDRTSYDGGELVINSTTEAQPIKLPAGDAVVYTATSVHRVNRVTRGTRLAAVGWIESLVRDPAHREILFDLRVHIDQLTAAHADPDTRASLVAVEKTRANLLRKWAEV